MPIKRFAGFVAAAVFALSTVGCSNTDSDMTHERLAPWESFKVTGTHELTFNVSGGDPGCYDFRSVVEEEDGVVEVALIEGKRPGAPQACTARAYLVDVLVTTDAPAADLDVQPLSEGDVDLNS